MVGCDMPWQLVAGHDDACLACALVLACAAGRAAACRKCRCLPVQIRVLLLATNAPSPEACKLRPGWASGGDAAVRRPPQGTSSGAAGACKLSRAFLIPQLLLKFSMIFCAGLPPQGTAGGAAGACGGDGAAPPAGRWQCTAHPRQYSPLGCLGCEHPCARSPQFEAFFARPTT